MAAHPDDRVAMNLLDLEECMVLLRWEVIGRLAVSIPGQAPSVVPVNFVVDHGNIVFRTGSGEKYAHLLDQPVSLQVDRFDWYRRVGWSILVQGMAQECTHAELDELELVPWAPGAMEHAIRITPSSVTGRRLELDVGPLDGRAYR